MALPQKGYRDLCQEMLDLRNGQGRLLETLGVATTTRDSRLGMGTNIDGLRYEVTQDLKRP